MSGPGVFTADEAVGGTFTVIWGLALRLALTVGEALVTVATVATVVGWSRTAEGPHADSTAMSGIETSNRNGDGKKRMEKGASITRKVLNCGYSRVRFLRGMIRVMQTGLVPPSHEAMEDFTVAAQ